MGELRGNRFHLSQMDSGSCWCFEYGIILEYPLYPCPAATAQTSLTFPLPSPVAFAGSSPSDFLPLHFLKTLFKKKPTLCKLI